MFCFNQTDDEAQITCNNNNNNNNNNGRSLLLEAHESHKHIVWKNAMFFTKRKGTPYVETTSALLSIVYVSTYLYLIFMESGRYFLWKALSGKCKFRKTRLGENLALLKGVNEFLPIL